MHDLCYSPPYPSQLLALASQMLSELGYEHLFIHCICKECKTCITWEKLTTQLFYMQTVTGNLLSFGDGLQVQDIDRFITKAIGMPTSTTRNVKNTINIRIIFADHTFAVQRSRKNIINNNNETKRPSSQTTHSCLLKQDRLEKVTRKLSFDSWTHKLF